MPGDAADARKMMAGHSISSAVGGIRRGIGLCQVTSERLGVHPATRNSG